MNADAALALDLFARAPWQLGGIVLRGDGPEREAWLSALGERIMLRSMPRNTDDERLLGGLDLAQALSGRAVAARGLLAEADGGVLVVRGAERIDAALAGRLAAMLDEGRVGESDARVGLVLLDDGREDERVPDALAERIGFALDFSSVSPELVEGRATQDSFARVARPSTGSGLTDQEAEKLIREISQACLALGVDSMRAARFALRVAQGADLESAIRLVLAHRATRLPARPDAEPPPAPEAQPDEQRRSTLDDVVLDSVAAVLPPDMLAALAAGQGRKQAKSDGAGMRQRSAMRGRPLGSRSGMPRGGARLALIDTLRAAAPWQAMRGRALGAPVAIRRSDLRIRRFAAHEEAVTIFAVDASGSAAAARLGEAKGAVELLLAEAYVKRTQVALIAFRGTAVELLLPPTRSLTRARRLLGDLPGGGGTPLAAGVTAARTLAQGVAARGRTPFVVLLTDGRANIALDGSAGGTAPQREAEIAGRALAAARIAAVLIDTGARPRAEGAALARAMDARYLPLPRADAARVSAAVKAARA